MLDFEYQLFVVPDGQFGSQTPNGSWTGMVGQLITGVISTTWFALIAFSPKIATGRVCVSI